ncbi:MAG TPA: efflux RND transporter permease subunit [Kiloniellaceae bacterium]|nr:efflux RND transporter permease subunit [Kiloniellaceae bacterium]
MTAMKTLLFRNTRLLFLVLGVILALAASAATSIGRQEDPTITNLFATVVTPYPGAEPSRVESLVTEKIEEELREIPEIDEIRSTSRTGVSVISVELSLYIGEDTIEQVWAEIRDALSDAARSFPAGVPEPELDTDRTSAYTAISAIVMRGDLAPNPAIQRRYAEILQDRLRQISTPSTCAFSANGRRRYGSPWTRGVWRGWASASIRCPRRWLRPTPRCAPANCAANATTSLSRPKARSKTCSASAIFRCAAMPWARPCG